MISEKPTLQELQKMMDENDGNLYLSNTQIKELPAGLCVGGNLYLSNTQIKELPAGLCVTGWLYLSNTQIKELPAGLCVGGNLYLSNTQIKELPAGLCVGGSLYLSGTQIKHPNRYKRLRQGDYEENRYIYADGFLTHCKKKREYKGYTYYPGKIKGKNVIQKGNLFAHCRSFKEGVQDIAFKEAKERGADQYKNLKLDSVLTKEEAIQAYRIITGACRQGTDQFLSTIKRFKKQYTVAEIIELTKGQYGASTFKRFFEE